MNHIWQEVKEHFQNSPRNSNPFRLRNHICDLKKPLTQNDSLRYGLEINEDSMAVFSAIGDTSCPPCNCDDFHELFKHIDSFMQSSSTSFAEDYEIHTRKDDTSSDEVAVYAMRDVLQWWAIWHGSLEHHHWKHMYVVFATLCDDISVPPQDLASGRYRVLGHTFADVLNGLRSEGVHPRDVRELEMLLWRGYIGQYLEKVDPEIRSQLLGKTTLMTQWRVMTANSDSVAILLLAARTRGPHVSSYDAVELASIAICFSMDLGKEALGVLRGEPTEAVAGGNRLQLKRELRWLYARTMESLDIHPSAPIIRQYATSGFIMTHLVDRYRERVRLTRFPLSCTVRNRIDSYRDLKIAPKAMLPNLSAPTWALLGKSSMSGLQKVFVLGFVAIFFVLLLRLVPSRRAQDISRALNGTMNF
ncbi:hypothetical protein N7540_010943 [Penicillium herquei]|nr:hypothetical protein N7540_010943 [Penicillium herquei]